MGRHEVALYEQIAQTLPAGLVPRCFEAHCDEATRECHLLLEDLKETHFALKDWPLPPTMSQCERIVAARARLHAQWWDDRRLGVSIGTWLDAEDGHLQRFADQVDRFIDRLGELLSPKRRDLYRLWQASTPVSQAAHGIPAMIWRNHLERIFTAIDDLGCRALLAA